MTRDDWEKVQRLFEATVKLEPAERREFLERAVADQPELRSDVEALLRSDADAGGFLESILEAGTALLASDQSSLAERARVGPYRLVRQIGLGGMGAVYLAERDDEEFQQRVAVKLVTPGLYNEEVQRRFRDERQILARLEHPNIARLLDGGTTDSGTPYFVMEYIEGEPLDVYCDRLKLRTRDRVELFLTVCSAVQYAHQNLVVHRDLKTLEHSGDR